MVRVAFKGFTKLQTKTVFGCGQSVFHLKMVIHQLQFRRVVSLSCQ